MSDLRKSSTPAKANTKLKKALEDLLGDGQLKTGKTVLDEQAQKASTFNSRLSFCLLLALLKPLLEPGEHALFPSAY